MIEMIGITVLWTFLYGYLIVASIDFGAGFFAFYSKIKNREKQVNTLIQRYLSPTWEVTNVFFVFFFVGIVGFFPDTAYYYGSALLVPASIVLILLAVRGSFYAFANYGSKESTLYVFLYGATGLFIPAAMSTVLTVSQGGFIEEVENQVVFKPIELFTSLYSWSVVLMAVVSVLYISSMFLLYYAHRAENVEVENLVRGWAKLWSIPTIIASVFVFIGLKSHAPWHFEQIMDTNGIAFLASFIFFLAALYFSFSRKKYGLGFLAVMAQYAAAWFGYGATHLPYILYPYINIQDGVVNEAMAVTLIIAFIAGLALLVPALYLLLRLFLFDQTYVKGMNRGGKA